MALPGNVPHSYYHLGKYLISGADLGQKCEELDIDFMTLHLFCVHLNQSPTILF